MLSKYGLIKVGSMVNRLVGRISCKIDYIWSHAIPDLLEENVDQNC